MPIDPLAIQKIEIYRGPAALRFGTQAVGGIVEAINNRIPTMAPFGGVAAELKTGFNTVSKGWESALLLDAGSRNAAIHADFTGRAGDDYRIPSYPYLFPPVPAPAVDGRQPNSSFRTESASAGGSWLFDGGYAGVAVTRFATDYHIPGHSTGPRPGRTSGWSRANSSARANSARCRRRSRPCATGPASSTTSTMRSD